MVYHRYNGCPYYRITFTKTQSVSNALMERKQIIRGKTVTLSSPFDQHQYDLNQSIFDGLLIAPNEKSFNIANKLNQDCLIHTFEYLNLCDLCAVAEVCPHFKNIAQYVFSRRFVHLKLEYDDYIFRIIVNAGNQFYFDHPEQKPLIKSIFKNFGSLIKSIDVFICKNKYTRKIFKLITTYCTEPKCLIEKLRLPCEIDNKKMVQRLLPVFSQLKYLDINVLDRGNETLLSVCCKLIELKIRNKCYIHSDEFIRVLQSNIDLKSLELPSIYDSHNMTSDIYRFIGMNSIKLETLTIHFDNDNTKLIEIQHFEKNIAYLRRLKYFKKIVFKGRYSDLPIYMLFDAIANSKIRIEELVVWDIEINWNVAHSLSRLNQIKHLEIATTTLDFLGIVFAINQMPFLSSLRIDDTELNVKQIIQIIGIANRLKYFECSLNENCIVTKDKLNEIVQLIKKRRYFIPMRISINGCKNPLMLHISKQIIEENRKWLEIEFKKS